VRDLLSSSVLKPLPVYVVSASKVLLATAATARKAGGGWLRGHHGKAQRKEKKGEKGRRRGHIAPALTQILLYRVITDLEEKKQNRKIP
jgi:hypothetical protein